MEGVAAYRFLILELEPAIPTILSLSVDIYKKADILLINYV